MPDAADDLKMFIVEQSDAVLIYSAGALHQGIAKVTNIFFFLLDLIDYLSRDQCITLHGMLLQRIGCSSLIEQSATTEMYACMMNKGVPQTMICSNLENFQYGIHF